MPTLDLRDPPPWTNGEWLIVLGVFLVGYVILPVMVYVLEKLY